MMGEMHRKTTPEQQEMYSNLALIVRQFGAPLCYADDKIIIRTSTQTNPEHVWVNLAIDKTLVCYFSCWSQMMRVYRPGCWEVYVTALVAKCKAAEEVETAVSADALRYVPIDDADLFEERQVA